jgi:hypothetical protein
MRTRIGHIGALFAVTLAMAGCSDKPGVNGLQATEQGVFYKSIWGRLYRIAGNELIPVQETPARTLPISTDGDRTNTLSGFSIHAEGGVRFQGGFEKIRINLKLGPWSQKQPSDTDRAKFAEGLADGGERLQAITVWFYDAEGYLAAPPRTITISGEGWTRVVDPKGNPVSYEFNAREAVDAVEAKDVSSVVISWWSSPPPLAAAQPPAWVVTPPAPDAAPSTSPADAIPQPAPH